MSTSEYSGKRFWVPKKVGAALLELRLAASSWGASGGGRVGDAEAFRGVAVKLRHMVEERIGVGLENLEKAVEAPHRRSAWPKSLTLE